MRLWLQADDNPYVSVWRNYCLVFEFNLSANRMLRFWELRMLNASLLSILEEASIAALTLTEGAEEAEFLNSRLTRAEVSRQIRVMTDIAGRLPARTRALMAEVDWAGWAATARQLDGFGAEADDALWFAVRSLIPATIMWLRVYRKNQPELFDYTAPMTQDIRARNA